MTMHLFLSLIFVVSGAESDLEVPCILSLNEITLLHESYCANKNIVSNWYTVHTINDNPLRNTDNPKYSYSQVDNISYLVDATSNFHDNSSESLTNGSERSKEKHNIPTSLCYVCKNQPNVGAFIKSSNLSIHYGGI